jgi:hypothetical protein
MRHLIKAKHHARIIHRLSYQIPTIPWHMRILLPKHHHQLRRPHLSSLYPLQAIIPLSQRPFMHIRRKVTHRSNHPLIKRTPQRQMPSQTHARRANHPRTTLHTHQKINRQSRVLIICFYPLGHLPIITLVGAGPIVRQGSRTGEFVVAGGSSANIAVAGYLAGEALDGAGDLVDFGPDYYAGEFGRREAVDFGVEDEDSWAGGEYCTGGDQSYGRTHACHHRLGWARRRRILQ